MHTCLTTARIAMQCCAFFVVLLLTCSWAVAGCGRPDVPASTASQLPQAQATATPTLSSLDATKQADAEQFAHEIETAAARPTPETLPPLPTNSPGIILTGLTTDCESIYFRGLIVPSNCWLDLVNRYYLFVVAGYSVDNPAQGKVGFYTAVPDGDFLSEFTHYTTPTQHGAVTITTVAPPRFTVEAADGTIFIFNVDTRQWEDPGSTPVPTR